MGVEERLLLDGIALRSGDVSPGHVECSATVVANFAHAGLTIGDGATVSAGKTADAILVEPLVKMGISFADSLIENTAKSGHGILASILTLMRLRGFELPAGFRDCISGLDFYTAEIKYLLIILMQWNARSNG
jgi:hypothetical protein